MRSIQCFKGLFSLLELKALKDMVCLFQVPLVRTSARINMIAIADSCLLTHVKHSLGDTAHFKLALKQVGLNNDGSLAGVMLVAGFSSRMARCSLPKPVLCLSLS